jgi:hypothetical protein
MDDQAQPPADRRATPRRLGRHHTSWATLAVSVCAAVGVVQFKQPSHAFETRPFASLASRVVPNVPAATPLPSAFGRSGEVRIRFALPGEAVQYPLDLRGDTAALSYRWVRLGDSATAGAPRPLVGEDVIAPAKPGFYQLALVRGEERRVVDGLTLAVLVPFTQKVGATLNGYRIGTYISERLGGAGHDRPEGFVEVAAERELDLPMTKHIRLADFITHDEQQVWPRYAAVNPRLLDKLELVIAEIARSRGDTGTVRVAVDVHSGFRAPVYNRRVPRAANDSRHQYGDAADVTIDANGDGRFTAADSRLTARAVEAVERQHPDLVGGLGLYTSRRYRTPYVHIDARGTRARWNG